MQRLSDHRRPVSRLSYPPHLPQLFRCLNTCNKVCITKRIPSVLCHRLLGDRKGIHYFFKILSTNCEEYVWEHQAFETVCQLDRDWLTESRDRLDTCINVISDRQHLEAAQNTLTVTTTCLLLVNFIVSEWVSEWVWVSEWMWVSEWVSEWLSELGLTSPSTHYRSFRRIVFPVNHLHWYWQGKKNKRQK